MSIIRTQVYLRKDQHHELRDQAHEMGIPFTELLRRALDEYLAGSARKANAPKKGLSMLVGLANGGPVDGALRHDDYIFGAIEADLARERKPPPAP